MNSLYLIFRLLPAKIKFSVFRSIALSAAAAFSDLVTLLLLAPVIESYSNLASETYSSSAFSINLSYLQYSLHIEPVSFALAFIVLVSLSSFLKTVTLHSCLRTGAQIGTFLSSQIYRNILYIPYEKFLLLNSSSIVNLLTAVTNQCALASNYVLQLVASVIIALMILLSMFAIDLTASILLFASLLLAYILTAYLFQSRFESNSRNVILCNDLQLQTVNETIGGIKQIAISSQKNQWYNDYLNLDRKMRIYQMYNVFYSALPRYLLESISIVALVTLGFFTYQFSKSLANSIAIVVTFTVALQKLLPVMQNVFTGWSGIKSSNAALRLVINSLSAYSDYNSPNFPKNNTKPGNLEIASHHIARISISNVSYQYPNSSRLSLDNVSLEIEPGYLYGLVGESGSGKSTLIDLLTSLLNPSSGLISLELAGRCYNLESVIDFYRDKIAYVSQNCHVSNGSIASNVAFDKALDFELLKRCTQYAGLLSFIQSLPDGFSYEVGDNGKTLSGGQKQRLAIARALYSQPSILFLDEATSAMDVKTQKIVVTNLKRYAVVANATIIMIAHRFESLQFCNRIIHLKNGRIANDNLSFQELMHPAFKL
jgi:ABC-type bacteriocin/lantibiotic exporter with double-glycine peptidase domain